MNETDIKQLKASPLFRNMKDSDISSALSGLRARERSYLKGAVILASGDTTDSCAVVLSGSVTIERTDYTGTRCVLGHVGPGDIFAEAYACPGTEPLMVDAVANEDCRVLFLRLGSDLYKNIETKPWAGAFISALLLMFARKNLALSGRSIHTSSRTIRERVMSYLNHEALKNGSAEFDIPFDRQQLADHLSVERSALSKELGKMRRDGLISTKKSHFILLDADTEASS